VAFPSILPNGPAIWGVCVPEYSGVQTISEPEICQGAGFKLHADARVRVQQPLQIYLEGRSKSKKCDKQLTHIVRVVCRAIFIFKSLCITKILFCVYHARQFLRWSRIG